MAASDRIIWRHNTTGELRLVDYVIPTIRAVILRAWLAADPTRKASDIPQNLLSLANVRNACIQLDQAKTTWAADYTPVGTVNVWDLPWEDASSGIQVARQYRLLRAGARWVNGAIGIDLAAAKAGFVKLVRSDLKARLADVRDEIDATFDLYRSQLRAVPTTVASEIANLDLAGLKAYSPTWPVKPDLP